MVIGGRSLQTCGAPAPTSGLIVRRILVGTCWWRLLNGAAATAAASQPCELALLHAGDTCILHNLYQTNRAAQYNRYTMAAAGQLADHAGGGFNDGDMLQPPGDTLMTVREPGLTSTEAASQFKLWALMKAPLILGVNWQQLSSLPTLDPSYFSLITNDEILSIQQDPSPQATLVSQSPSMAQQKSATLNITIQRCDLSRIDQRFSPHPSGPGGGGARAIKAASSNLCISAEDSTVLARPCADTADAFALQQDDQLAIAKILGGTAQGLCLSEHTVATEGEASSVKGVLTVVECLSADPIDNHSRTDPVPLYPLAAGHDIGQQMFVWGAKSQQIVAGGSGNCLTLGNPNLGSNPHPGNAPGQPGAFTNNGTLQHEVWQGPLTPAARSSSGGAGAVSGGASARQVVALFNKGDETETLVARSEVLSSAASGWLVRDVVARKDRPAVALGGDLTAQVPSHGVALFVLEARTG
jgi:hypothetical protein